MQAAKKQLDGPVDEMEWAGVKLFITISFFGFLLYGAYWADKKIDEYWKDDDDGSQTPVTFYAENFCQTN